MFRFEFLQASSGKLIKPNVPPNHSWSGGDKVQRLAGQGDIYVHPTYLFTVQVCKLHVSKLSRGGRVYDKTSWSKKYQVYTI